jgi:lipopolysaccharide/colanic/teichoic acid biosynthesis glycosyltransferase
VVAALLLVAAAPLMAVLLGLVARDGGNPLFGHERIGRHGRRFRCWKVRSMLVDAPERLEALLQACPDAKAEWDRTFKLSSDPRVTALGTFLRQTRLDELPQLWNVLIGEMSLVGPRPITSPELARYGCVARLYCSVRPGLTGLWQVRGAEDTSYEERVAMDRDYIENPSILRDFGLLLRTSSVMLRRGGR